MRSSQHRGRQFPPQISKEELLQRTRQTLTEKGVDYVSQSKYVVEISKEVVGFDEPIFSSLQPEIKIRDSDAWNQAYTIVMTFLQENGMEQTMNAIDVELQGQSIPDSYPDRKSEEFLKPLLKISNQLKRKAFSARVAEFTGKYKQRRAKKSGAQIDSIQDPSFSQSRQSTKPMKQEQAKTQDFTATNSSSKINESRFSQNASLSQTRQPAKPVKQETAKAQDFTATKPVKQEPVKTQDFSASKSAKQDTSLSQARQPANQPKVAEQPKKSPWDAIPMAEPPTKHANSFMDDMEEEEEEDLPAIPQKMPVMNKNVPPSKAAPPKAKSGWDAPAFDDNSDEVSDVVSDVVDDEEIVIGDDEKGEEDDVDFGEEDEFDLSFDA